MDIRPVRFSISPTGGDRIHYITPEDVQIVLSRLPVEEYSQLKAVHFNDQAWGNRLLIQIGGDVKLHFAHFLQESV